MAKHWYYVKDGQQYGPISAFELKQKADSGELGPDDLVRSEDRQKWSRAAATNGLFTTKNVPTPPSSPSAPPPLPTLSKPPPLPPGSADSSSPNNVAQFAVRPFGEWYRTSWLGRKLLVAQVIVWLLYGFMWIPYWYFSTATPPGSLRGKWASLGIGGKLAFLALTCTVCFGLVRASREQRVDTSNSNGGHTAVRHSTDTPLSVSTMQPSSDVTESPSANAGPASVDPAGWIRNLALACLASLTENCKDRDEWVEHFAAVTPENS